MGLATMPTTLDPRYVTDAVSTRIARLLYEPLTTFDARGRPQPGMASWQQLAPDHYRFRLRPDRRAFPDQRLPSAQDVKATFESILDVRTASPHRGALSHIVAIAAPSAEVIDFRLNRPDYLFPGYLNIGILPADKLAADHDFNQWPWGSGAFAFVTRSGANAVSLSRRSDGLLLSFVHVSDPTVRVLKLVRGEIDLLQNDLPPEMCTYLRQRPDVTVRSVPGTSFAYLGFNFEDPLTANPVVRRAIAHAIDRDSIIRYLFAENAVRAEAILPADHWAGHPGLAAYAYEPERARRLVATLGFSRDRPLTIEYKTSSDPFRLRVAAALQAQLAEVGIDLVIRSYDWGTFFGDIKAGRFQTYSLAWVGVENPDVFRYVYHTTSVPPTGANRGRYRSEPIDAAIHLAETAKTQQQRIAAYRDIQAIAHADLAYLPLWYEGHFAALGPRVSDYQLNRRGDYDALAKIKLATAQ